MGSSDGKEGRKTALTKQDASFMMDRYLNDKDADPVCLRAQANANPMLGSGHAAAKQKPRAEVTA